MRKLSRTSFKEKLRMLLKPLLNKLNMLRRRSRRQKKRS
jgi:hypothetical protein